MTTDTTTEAETIEAPQASQADAGQVDASQTAPTPAAEQPVEDVGALFKAEVARRNGTEPPRADPAATEGAAKGAEAPAKGAEPTGPAAAEPDPWAGVDPALKRQFESVMLTNKTLAGRVSTQQRLLNELQAARGESPAPKKAMSPEALSKVRTDFPELSDVVDEIVDLRTTLQAQASTVGSIAEERQEAHAKEQIAMVAARHKDWFEIYKSPEFEAWKAANPAFGQIADSSVNGTEISHVLDVFKFSTGRAPAAPAGDPPNPAPSAAAKPDAGAKRAAQLEASIAVSGKAPAAPTGNGSGPDATSALWRAEVARRAAQKGARA